MSPSNLSTMQCPSCGATLPVEDESSIVCQYCGNRILVPPEYRPDETSQPEPIETVTDIPNSQLPIPGKVATVIHPNPNRTILAVFLFVGIFLCVGILLFVAAGNQDRTNSNFLTSPASTDAIQINPQAPAPSLPALPTFTPMSELLLNFGTQGTGQGEMDDARFIAIDPNGNIFVSDYSGGRVQKFDPQGNFLMLINVPASDPDTEIYTRGIGVDSQGFLYVARNGDILVFDGSTGSLINTIPSGWPSIYYDSLLVTRDILYTNNGMAGTDDILKLSPQGDILLHKQEVIESVDKDDPALNMQLAVDSQGQIYILSNFGPYIYVYDALGNYLYRFGEEGHGRGQLDLSSNLLAIDPRGRLYVASSYRIDQFDNLGNYLNYSFDVSDDSNGGVPMGMTFDTQGFLYITCNNGKILKYQINSP